MLIKTSPSRPSHAVRQRGATTVEYAIVIALFVITVLLGAWQLVDPLDEHSILPNVFNTVGDRIGTFGTVK